MSKQVISTTICDVCAHNGNPDVDAIYSFHIKIDRDITRVLDVCEGHYAGILRLRTILRTRGTLPALANPDNTPISPNGLVLQ